jgi:hypothetical protein
MIRPEVRELTRLGQFPASANAVPETIKTQERLLRDITPPVSDDEARELARLFGPDDYFGAAWTILHLIETSPCWPLLDCLSSEPNEWIARLKQRLDMRGGIRGTRTDIDILGKIK